MQSLKPTLKLTFIPDNKYFTNGHHVDIFCEIINPNDDLDAAQLWHIDLKTGKQTPVSRLLMSTPSDDSPDIFKQNKNRRLEYIKKNHIRIKHLQVEDSARYKCSCADCEEMIVIQTREFQVMKLVEPKWRFEPGWPLQENAKTTIKCTADDFYPYVGSRIVRNHHEIHNEGKITIPSSNTYPQNFSWEATVTPTADWHNSTLRCTVIQGSTEQHAIKRLDVLFTPRFLKCDEKQYVSLMRDKSTIECSYSGNPSPRLTWFRRIDEKAVTLDAGITTETIPLDNGRYQSIVTFDRELLIAKSLNGQMQTNATEKNYYEQLLNGGFIVELTYNNEVKVTRKIDIVSDEYFEWRETSNDFEWREPSNDFEWRKPSNDFGYLSNKQNRVIFFFAGHSLILQFILHQIKKILLD